MSIDDAFVDIVEQGFDAGIRIGEMVEREMMGVRVSADLRMAVVGSPAYFAARGKPKHPRDLHAHDCINYRRRSLGVVYRWEFTEDGKDFEIAVDGRIVVNDGEIMLSAATAGSGSRTSSTRASGLTLPTSDSCACSRRTASRSPASSSTTRAGRTSRRS